MPRKSPSSPFEDPAFWLIVLIISFVVLASYTSSIGNWGATILFLLIVAVGIVGLIRRMEKESGVQILAPILRKIFGYRQPHTPSVQVREEHAQATVSSPINDIIQRIREFTPYRRPSKEKELEIMLVTHLRHWYPEIRTQLTYERATIDAQIGKIGIEIKLQPDEGELDRLYGQIDKYLDNLDSVIAVIFNERSRESIESFMRRLVKRGWLDNRVFVLSL